jgi:hypothetical protein
VLARLRAAGIPNREVVELMIRAMQAELLFSLCCLLEDPGDVEQEVAHHRWGLFLVDEDGRPMELLSGNQARRQRPGDGQSGDKDVGTHLKGKITPHAVTSPWAGARSY